MRFILLIFAICLISSGVLTLDASLGLSTSLLGTSSEVSVSASICLDSYAQCYKKQYQLQGGQIQISFDFKVLTNLLLFKSGLIISLNNQQLYKVPISQAGKNIKIKLSKLPPGTYTLTICPFRVLLQPLFVFCVENLKIQQKLCLPTLGNDLIVNGGFQQNKCQSSYCLWSQSSFRPQFLPGWLPNPQIELGSASIYNRNFPNTRIVQLDATINSCIKQKLSLKQGKYYLKFDWAARESLILQSNGVQVKVNGLSLTKLQAKDYVLHSQTIEIIVPPQSQISDIQICGAGISDTAGSIVDNIKLFLVDECSNFQIFKY